MIVADTSAVVALLDRDDHHHDAMRRIYDATRDGWVLPWVILPEVDFLLRARVGRQSQFAFVDELGQALWQIEWVAADDLLRAGELCRRYEALGFGLTDAVVMSTAERLRAEAIATLDLRDFGAVALRDVHKLYPRDWSPSAPSATPDRLQQLPE